MRAGEGSDSNGTSRPVANGSSSGSGQKAALSPTNGSSGVMNGSSTTNGHSASSGKSKPTYYGHDREEVSRILIQALTDLGYNRAAASLSQESGYELESPAVAAFRNAVIQGEWDEAEELLFGASTLEGGVNLNGNGLLLQEGIDKNEMRFALRQQKFLELLEQRDTGRALMVLRMELTPLYQDTASLHFLSGLLMCQSPEDLKNKAEWDGAEGESRYRLLSELSRCISPSVMLPENRLAVLLQQVKRTQISNCLYHNTSASPSLYQDHACDRSNFPVRAVMDIERHTGEVWFVKFSNDGRRLASCGMDGNAVIYSTESFQVISTLPNNESGVCSLSWSPDNSMVLTCSQDKRARLWRAETGELKKTLTRFGEPVSSSVWAPDGQTFVTGCLDKDRNLCQWNLNGELVYDWQRPHRIQGLAVSPNGHYLVAMDITHHIHVYNFVTRELEYEMDIKTPLSSIAISEDSKSLLIREAEGQLRMIDLDTRETTRLFRAGEPGGANVILASFGGANESFVVSGSDSGSIYIWHRENGQLIEQLSGHEKGCCSAISWNPANPCMFASAGDDGKVRIWSNEEVQIEPVRPAAEISTQASRLSRAQSRTSSTTNGW